MKTLRKYRIKELIEYDKGYGNLVIGTDEAGRGPVAGPVVAGAVFFPDFNDEVLESIKFIDDSKRFSSNPGLRKEISEQIKKNSIYGIAQCSVDEIEQYNILQASLLAMKKACREVLLQKGKKEKEAVILIDGNFTIPGIKSEQKAIKKGDSFSASIAAASILAKVYRDNIMEELSLEYPLYEWHNNKGYGTSSHIQAIKTHGCCKWHRKNFLNKVFIKQKKLF